MHILFESHGLNETGESETYKAYLIVREAMRYAQVSIVVPEPWAHRIPSLEAEGARVIPVPYDAARYPFNQGLDYMYSVFARGAVEATRDIIGSVDLIHRLNPNAVRYASDLAFTGRPFVIGPMGWSRVSESVCRSPVARVRNVLKRWDQARLSSRHTRLRRMYDAADAIVLVNGAAAEAFPLELRGKCRVAGEWVDTSFYSYVPPEETDTPVILYVGRLVRYKGLEFLLESLARMVDLRWELRIVGDGPLEASLRRQCTRLGLDARVTFVGRVPRPQVVEHYHASHICCFPGLNESSGNVNVEAMSCGRPVVAADWAGPAEIVQPDCGILAPVTSPAAFIRGIESGLRALLADPGLRLAMGRAGRARAVMCYDQVAVLDFYHRVHEHAVTGGTHGA